METKNIITPKQFAIKTAKRWVVYNIGFYVGINLLFFLTRLPVPYFAWSWGIAIYFLLVAAIMSVQSYNQSQKECLKIV